LDFFGRPIILEPSHGQLSGDAGLPPIRQFDQYIGLTQASAEALDDPRDPDLTEHTFLEMVRSRVYGILPAPRTRTTTTPSAATRALPRPPGRLCRRRR
jgi:hypothetical protein